MPTNRLLPALPLSLLSLAVAAAEPKAHFDAIVVDGHIDTPSLMLDAGFDIGTRGDLPDCRSSDEVYAGTLDKSKAPAICTNFDLTRAAAGGFDAAFFSIYVDPSFVGKAPKDGGGSARRAFDMIAASKAQLARHADRAVLATTAAEVRAAAAQGKFAALMGIEGGHAIEDSLALLGAFRREGVRYMTLTHNNTNDWADSCCELDKNVKPHGGLTDYGRNVVREMNRLGIVVDISHVADDTFWDAIETTRSPVMASHSSARAIAPHPRNLSDEQLRAVAKNGGVVMINFFDGFIDAEMAKVYLESRNVEAELKKQYGGDADKVAAELAAWRKARVKPVPLERLVQHVEHMVEVMGADHVGLGSDFDGVSALPEGMKSVQDLPNLSRALLARGMSETDLKKVLGGNILRVLEANERNAAP